MKTDLFQSHGHCWILQIFWHIECSSLTASSFRIWNSSTGIPSPPLALFVVMLPKTHLTLHSRMPGSRWVITPLWLSGSWRSFYSSSVYSCHLFLISSASVRSIPFLSFFSVHLCMKCYLRISNFLVDISSLSHSIVFLYFFDHLGRLSYLSLLFFGTRHSDEYIFLFILCLALHLFYQLFVRPPQTTILLFSFLFLRMVLITACCTMSLTSVHSSSGTLSIRSNPLNLLVISTV